jgi:hypothetical protein
MTLVPPLSVAVGGDDTTTGRVDVVDPHALVAVTFNTTSPAPAGWNVMELPVVADSMVPPTMLQVCVIPSRAGTDALPEVASHNPEEAVIGEGSGAPPGVMFWVACAVWPHEFVAITVSVTVDPLAVNDTDSPVAGVVNVPPVMDHVCVTPVTAATDALAAAVVQTAPTVMTGVSGEAQLPPPNVILLGRAMPSVAS